MKHGYHVLLCHVVRSKHILSSRVISPVTEHLSLLRTQEGPCVKNYKSSYSFSTATFNGLVLKKS